MSISIFSLYLWQEIFQTRKDMVIKKTVARLPLPAVLPLVQEVSQISVKYKKNDNPPQSV